MKNLRNRINHFYSCYDLTTAETRKMSRADMGDHDALMTAYESIYLTMEEYEGSERGYAWLSDLYGDLGDYISDGNNAESATAGNGIATVFGVLGLFVFAMCATVSLDWLTIGGLLLSVAVIMKGGR